MTADREHVDRSTSDTDRRLTLTLPATRTSVDAARVSVLEYLAPSALTPRTIFDVELVLEEVLMNVVTHGSREGEAGMSGHSVELIVESTPNAIRMTFVDDGVAFDPTTAASPPRAETLSDAVPGGLGIDLVRRRARSLDYRRRDDRNVLTIEVARA